MSRSKLLKTVKVGPFTYKLRELALADAEEAGVMGECDRHGLLMRVQMDDMHPARAAEATLHEVLHACWLDAGLDVPGLVLAEEVVVNGLSLSLARVIVDNPEFFPWLQSQLAQP